MDFVCISVSDWDDLKTGKHHVSSELARRGHRVLYIEPGGSLFLLRARHRRKFANFVRGGVEVASGLTVYAPLHPFYFSVHTRWVATPITNTLNWRFSGLFIKRVMRRLGFQDAILWFWDPKAVELADVIPHRAIVYHCGDDASAFQHALPFTGDLEKVLIKHSDVIFVTARRLFDRIHPLNESTFYVPNAANIEHFFNGGREDVSLLTQVQRIPQPRLVYVGSIREWLDFELIQAIAKAHPDWSIVMVGPVRNEKEVNEYFDGISNVHWLGRVDYQVLPSILRRMDLGLIPFKINDLTLAVNPLKVYEYLAVGIPVVSTPLPEMVMMEEMVSIAGNTDQFVEAIEKNLAEDTPERTALRLQCAREHSWGARVDEMLQAITEVLHA
jgi:glycosyltransferase involved in cell wall biosynthesis